MRSGIWATPLKTKIDLEAALVDVPFARLATMAPILPGALGNVFFEGTAS
jgi:hypothetical protein